MEQSTGDKMGGKSGSLDNPIVYENVPGHIIPILEREFDDFDTEARKFLDGVANEDDFIGFRLKQGVYGQRQADVHMVRVKLPLGGVTPEQMEAFAYVAEEFAPLRKGHITTRQNIQLHHIPLEDTSKAIHKLGDVGLSTREACGNTVRNVTGDPFAGVREGEQFDPTPYGGAFIRYFVRQELTQLLPRKFKVAFTSTNEDVAITGIHDLGFIPRIRDNRGKQQLGFEIKTGGGTSIMPRVGYTLYEFTPVNEYLKVSEAVLRIFDRQEDLRANRMRARLKFLVDRVGIDEFRRMVDEEMEGDWVNKRDFDLDGLLFIDDEESKARSRHKPSGAPGPSDDGQEFEKFVASNVDKQRQEGFSTVEVKVTRGDLTPEQFRGLASIMRDFTGGYARTSVQQNLVLRWIHDESVYEVWKHLKELGLGDAGAQEITDVVSCPGTDSCKLGITSSMGLNNIVQEMIEGMGIDDPLTRKIHVKISGCPNGCAQHHIANIGFYGAAIKVGDRQLPAYIAHLGGGYENGNVRFGKRLKVRIPAKRVPVATERFVHHYEENRNQGEPFNDFVDRVGVDEFEGIAKDIGMPAQFDDQSMSEFIDWDRQDLYEVQRGEGECAK